MSNFTDINKAFNNSSQNNYEYNSVIIKPPDRNKTHGTITKTLVIDSRDRDYNKYPDSNKFRVEITEEYRDVTSLELVYGIIPNTYYNIRNTNNNFYINEDSGMNQIQIHEGKYSNNSLLEYLNGKQGNIFKNLKNKYNFSKKINELTLRIQSNNNFTYNADYESNNCQVCPVKSIDKILGFSNKSYEASSIDLSYIFIEPNNISYQNKKSDNDYKIYKINAISNTNEKLDFRNLFVKGDYVFLNGGNIQYSVRIYNILNENTIEIESLDNNNPIALIGNIFNNIYVLNGENIYDIEKKDYVILKISDAKLVTSLNNPVNNSYTIISLTDETNTIIGQSTLPERGVIKYFNPPLGKLFWLDIEFLNYDGTLFDFKGQENMLMFVVSQMNQPGKYNNIIDKW